MAEFDEDLSPVLLIVRDTKEHVFGAVVSSAIRPNDHFFGTGDSCFLWRFTGEVPHTRLDISKIFPIFKQMHTIIFNFSLKNNKFQPIYMYRNLRSYSLSFTSQDSYNLDIILLNFQRIASIRVDWR